MDSPKRQLLGAFDEAVQHIVHAATTISSASPASPQRAEFEVRACMEELLRAYGRSMHTQHSKALQDAEEHCMRMERLRRKRTAMQAAPLEGKENMAPSKAKGIGGGDGALEKSLADRQRVVELREQQVAGEISRHETRAAEFATLEARMSTKAQELADARRQQHEATERELSQQRLALEELAKAIADSERKAAISETRVSEREKEVRDTESRVAQREKQISNATAAAHGSEREIKEQLLAAEQRVQEIECKAAATKNSCDSVEGDFQARNQDFIGKLSAGRAALRQQEAHDARRKEEMEVQEQAIHARERNFGERETALVCRERNLAEREQSQKDAWQRLQERLADQEREQSLARQALEDIRLDVIKRQHGLREQLSSMKAAEQNLARERASLAAKRLKGKHAIQHEEEARSTLVRQLEAERSRQVAEASALAARNASLQRRGEEQRMEMTSLASEVKELAALEEALVSRSVDLRQAEQRVILKREHLTGWVRRIQDQEHELAVGLAELKGGLTRGEDVRARERAVSCREREQAAMDQRLLEREQRVAARDDQPAVLETEPAASGPKRASFPQSAESRGSNLEDARRGFATGRRLISRKEVDVADYRNRFGEKALNEHASQQSYFSGPSAGFPERREEATRAVSLGG